MLEGIPLGWQQIGAVGLVTIFVLMMWTDRIITRSRHLEVVNMLKDRITEGDKRLCKVEKERDDALALAKTAIETSNIQARTKDEFRKYVHRTALSAVVDFVRQREPEQPQHDEDQGGCEGAHRRIPITSAGPLWSTREGAPPAPRRSPPRARAA